MHPAAPITSELLLRHEAFVVALARRLTSSAADADDLAQETWLATLRSGRPPLEARSWLATILRRRASNARRSERVRARLEGTAASAEGTTETSPLERLELQSLVVRCVLELEEPARSVVIDHYYEGLSLAEIALRRGVPAGTVRSQMSRAHAALREKLDRRHPDSRGGWLVMLTELVKREDALFAGSGKLVAASALAWTVAGLTLAGIATVVTLALRSSPEPTPALALSTNPDAGPAMPALVTPDEDTVARAPVEQDTKAAPVTEPARVPSRLDELPSILQRTRQIKTVLIERKLTVPPELARAHAFFTEQEGSGITRMIDRMTFGFETDLPWLQGGGAFFSFTTNSHHYQSDPQIGLERGQFKSGFFGSADGVIVDLGESGEAFLAGTGGFVPADLPEPAAKALRIAQAEYAVGSDGQFEERLYDLLLAEGLDSRCSAILNHVYFLRARSPGEFDVRVAFQIVEMGEDTCTLLWRVQSGTQRTMGPRNPDSPPLMTRKQLLEPPPEMSNKTDVVLLAELAELRRAGTELLFAASTSLEPGWEPVTLGVDGITRLVDVQSGFTELPAMRGGGAYWSFARRSSSYDEEPDVSMGCGMFQSGFYVGMRGFVLDLGTASAEPSGSSDQGGARRRLLSESEIPYAESPEAVRDAITALHTKAGQLGIENRAKAVQGHTYLARVVSPGEHDVLASFRVLRIDEYGAVIAWKVLRSWAVLKGR